MSLLSDSNQRVLTDPDYKSGAINRYAMRAISCGPSETRTRVSSVTSWKDDPYPMRP